MALWIAGRNRCLARLILIEPGDRARVTLSHNLLCESIVSNAYNHNRIRSNALARPRIPAPNARGAWEKVRKWLNNTCCTTAAKESASNRQKFKVACVCVAWSSSFRTGPCCDSSTVYGPGLRPAVLRAEGTMEVKRIAEMSCVKKKYHRHFTRHGTENRTCLFVCVFFLSLLVRCALHCRLRNVRPVAKKKPTNSSFTYWRCTHVVVRCTVLMADGLWFFLLCPIGLSIGVKRGVHYFVHGLCCSFLLLRGSDKARFVTLAGCEVIEVFRTEM